MPLINSKISSQLKWSRNYKKKLYADPNAIQQINFRGNLNRVEDSTMFFIIKEAKGTGLHFSRGAIKVLGFLFRFNVI